MISLLAYRVTISSTAKCRLYPACFIHRAAYAGRSLLVNSRKANTRPLQSWASLIQRYIWPLWNHYQSEIENYLEYDNNINEYRMIADERYRGPVLFTLNRLN